jgi:hypothetical protein
MQEVSMTTPTRRRVRTLGWVAAGSIVALLMLGTTGGALAALGGNQLNQTPPISSDDVNFQGDEEECSGTAAGSVVWHFVLTKTTADTTALLEAVFASGTVTQSADAKTGQTLHWFITTDAPDTLLGASTNATGKNLNLSHICNGGETTTTTISTTTSTVTSGTETSTSGT